MRVVAVIAIAVVVLVGLIADQSDGGCKPTDWNYKACKVLEPFK